jgi:sugar phosphate isomerase/epimerase
MAERRNPITFSTLACPEWPAEAAVEEAAAFGYEGLEWRGGEDGHVNPSLPASARARLRRQVESAGLFSLAVTAYSSFTSDSPAERQANVDHLRQHLDLAADLGASYVRAFVGELPPGADRQPYYPQIIAGLAAAAEHAARVGVRLAVEPHDDFVRPASIAPLLEALPPDAVCAVWDIGNAWAAGEDPADSLRLLRPRLGYVQVKDGLGRGSAWRLTEVGAGQVPLQAAFAWLLAEPDPYPGAFSLEWERTWHPELPPAEMALPKALRLMRAWLAEAAGLKDAAR